MTCVIDDGRRRKDGHRGISGVRKDPRYVEAKRGIGGEQVLDKRSEVP
jgi:hypothetical protein